MFVSRIDAGVSVLLENFPLPDTVGSGWSAGRLAHCDRLRLIGLEPNPVADDPLS